MRSLVCLSAVLLLSFAACAPLRGVESAVRGETPDGGRVVLRSGLAWLDESAPVFQPLLAELRRLCEENGWTVVDAAPSRTAPVPDDPLPPGASSPAALPDDSIYSRPGAGRYRADGRPEAEEDVRTRERAAELAKAGRLPETKLRGYEAPADDGQLPPSVMAVSPPDFSTFLFAQSQLRGRPSFRGTGSIPFRVPDEMRSLDPAAAEYALLFRFAVVSPPARVGAPIRTGGGGAALAPVGGGGGYAAPPLVGGIGTLGFGVSGGTGLYGGSGRGLGSVGDYMRGYEGNAPGSGSWSRDADYRSRNQARQMGPEPVQSVPPHGLSHSVDDGGRSAGQGDVPAGMPVLPYSGILVLEMDLYDLAPARDGGDIRLLWSGRAAAPATDDVAGALPELAASLL